MDWNVILNALLTALITGLTWLAGEAVVYIRAKRKDSKLARYIEIASGCVIDAVGDVGQTIVDKIKEGSVDGKAWDDEAKAEVFEIAKTKALEHLGITGKTLLEEALGDFDGWINSKIEAEVKRLAVK